MTYYCEKCGHKMDASDTRCAFCGARQKRLTDGYTTKKCKKCKRDIYVNANFCPYCGADQAILDLHHDIPDDVQNKHDEPTNAQQRLVQNLMGANLDNQDALNDFIKKMNDAGIKVRVIKPEEKNETVHPGLFTSTKLMLRDMFKINKRMGINDYWWGYAGLICLMLGFAFLFGGVIQFLQVHLTERIIWGVVITVAIIFQFILLTATWRRIHDINFPNWTMFLWLIPFGRIILYLLCLMGPRLDHNPYTFSVQDYHRLKK